MRSDYFPIRVTRPQMEAVAYYEEGDWRAAGRPDTGSHPFAIALRLRGRRAGVIRVSIEEAEDLRQGTIVNGLDIATQHADESGEFGRAYRGHIRHLRALDDTLARLLHAVGVS